jgi:hypothetical protein
MAASENEPVLCYVHDGWAYFTTQPLDKQWGDDWNDAPYGHNAGEPYEFHEYDTKRGKSPWKITKLAFCVDMETPCDGQCNSPYSVEAINRGDVAWLRPSRYGSAGKEAKPIHAGVTTSEFCRLIRLAGGKVYLESTEA